MVWQLRIESEVYDWEHRSWVVDSAKFGPYETAVGAVADYHRALAFYLDGREIGPRNLTTRIERWTTPDGKPTWFTTQTIKHTFNEGNTNQ
jgi:hypothetical protein